MILKDKVALVTGSTSGIGLAIARALAAEGARVMLHGFGDRDANMALKDELAALSGDCAGFSDADLSDPEAIDGLVAGCTDELGSPSILVNNAGVQHVSPIESFPAEKWDWIMAVNLSAVFHTTRLCLPSMRQRGFGRIINTASAHSLVASPNKAPY